MQILQLTVFLATAFALPFLVTKIARMKIPIAGRLAAFVLFLIGARYLLGSVWVPEGIWALRFKALIATVSCGLCWTGVRNAMVEAKVRGWTVFVLYMIFPFVVCFAFLPSTIAIGGLYAGDRTWWSCGFDSKKGCLSFWVVWTALSWLQSVSTLTSWKSRLSFFVAGVGAVALFLSANLRERVTVAGENIVELIKENVTKRWPFINEQTAKIVAAWERVVDEDRKIVAIGKIGTQKLKAATNIAADVRRLRQELLSFDSQELLMSVNRLDEKIASSRLVLAEMRERRILASGDVRSLDADIAKQEADIADLESDRAKAVAGLRQALKAIGLELPEGSVFLTVDLGDIVNNAIVAKNVGVVVENLRQLMNSEHGGAKAAKRYYGAYVVMLDVQKECFRQYLEKAQTGVWYDGVRTIAQNAEAAKSKNEAKAESAASEFEKRAFLHSAATNAKTLMAARKYIAVLDRHSEIVREKLIAAERMHDVALSFWESADIAGSFSERIMSDRAEFEALLALKLPKIAFWGDLDAQAEFEAITKKLLAE